MESSSFSSSDSEEDHPVQRMNTHVPILDLRRYTAIVRISENLQLKERENAYFNGPPNKLVNYE